MSERVIVRIYYRSLYDGGKVWCESRDPEEVIERSPIGDPHGPFVFERLEVEEVTHSWEPWDVAERMSSLPTEES